MKTQTGAAQVQAIRLVGGDLPSAAVDESRCIISVVEHPILVPVAGYNQPHKHQGGPSDQAQDERAHSSIVAGWRTLRCQICRHPLQRALLVPGSAVLGTCRRDKASFVFVATETGILVMRRGDPRSV